MREGVLASPLARAGRFLWGAFLGFLGLLVGGAVLLAGAWLWSATEDFVFDDGSAGATRLVVDGADLTRRGGAGLQIDSMGASLRLKCRGVCDDLRIDPSVVRPKVRLLDVSGECVRCASHVEWRARTGGAAVLSWAPQLAVQS